MSYRKEHNHCSNKCAAKSVLKFDSHKFEKKILKTLRQFDCVHVIDKLPYTICKPGTYKVACNLEFKPSFSSYSPPDPRAVQAAITIKSSDVHLDLGTSVISQHVPANPSQQVPYCVGILVPDPAPNNTEPDYFGYESIYISGENAIISNFSMIGIRIFAHIYDVRIENVTVKNCAALGSAALRPFPSYLPHNIYDYAPWSTNAMTMGGIVIGETDFGGLGSTFFTELTPPSVSGIPAPRVSSLILNNVSCLDNFYSGLFIAFSTDVTINLSHFDDTWSDTGYVPELQYAEAPNGASFFGGGGNNSVDGDGVINMVVTNSTFNNTELRGDYTTDIVYGYFGGVQVFDSLNCTWENCQFNGTSMTFASASFTNFITGFIGGGMLDTVFNNCTFDNISSVGGSVMGFHSSGSGGTKGGRNLKLINCTANNIRSLSNLLTVPTLYSDIWVYGFLVAFAENSILENCTSSEIISNGPLDYLSQIGGFYLFGFGLASTGLVKNSVVRNCIAQKCMANNGGQAAGFYIQNGIFTGDGSIMQSVALENCIAERGLAGVPDQWNAGIPYFIGDLVSYNGGLFSSLINGNLGNTPPAVGTSDTFWQGQTISGNVSVGCGFLVQSEQPNPTSIPWTMTGCQALHNKGIDFDPNLGYYSAGIFLTSVSKATVTDCIVTDNIYGVLLQNSVNCAIRNNTADNNLDSTSNTGEGFTDVGTSGTPTAPTPTSSVFENNKAYNNGQGVFTGTNGNYNINVGGAVPGNLPLLESQPATGTWIVSPPGSTYYANLYNISSIQ